MAAYGRILLFLIRNFFSLFLAHRMGVWRPRPALAYDPDVESGIRDDDDDDDLAELAVAYFERLNELDRASVVHEPRSLAELAFAAIPVTEPLDDWTSNQVYYFGPAGVILETESLSDQNSLTNYFVPSNSIASVVDPALPGPSWAFQIPNQNYFDQPVVDPPESNPTSAIKIPLEIDLDLPEVDSTPLDLPSGIEILPENIILAHPAAIPTEELSANPNFKVETFGNCQSLGNRGLPRLLRLRYSKFSVFSKYLTSFCVCSLVAILFIVESV